MIPFPLILSAPSGAGKTTIARALLARRPDLGYSVSCTTRAPRPGEADGVHYHFLSDEQFEQLVREGAFVEHARYSGRRYGTLRSELERRTAEGRPVVLEIEVQGARQVAHTMPEAVRIFIAPPSEDALRVRLQGRGTDDPEQVDERLRAAREELAAQREFPHVIVNDRLERALDELVEIVDGQLASAGTICRP